MAKKRTVILCLVSFLAGCLCLLLVAYWFGPRSDGGEMDLYTGHSRHVSSRLGHTWATDIPDGPHVEWARKNREPGKAACRYVPGGTATKGWFSATLHVDYCYWDVVKVIFDSSRSEAEKVRLLREFHADLDAVPVDGSRELAGLMGKWQKILLVGSK